MVSGPASRAVGRLLASRAVGRLLEENRGFCGLALTAVLATLGYCKEYSRNTAKRPYNPSDFERLEAFKNVIYTLYVRPCHPYMHVESLYTNSLCYIYMTMYIVL